MVPSQGETAPELAAQRREPNEREALAFERVRPVALLPAVEPRRRVPNVDGLALDEQLAPGVVAEPDDQADALAGARAAVPVRPEPRVLRTFR